MRPSAAAKSEQKAKSERGRGEARAVCKQALAADAAIQKEMNCIIAASSIVELEKCGDNLYPLMVDATR